MREIKFRAWRKEEPSRMVTVGETTSGFILDEYPETVMQYTGLKDKNGKEIYEGDIVHIDKNWTTLVDGTKVDQAWSVEYGCFGDPHNLYVFNQLNSCREVIFDIDEMNYLMDGVVTPLPCFRGIGEGLTEMIVVGNIYENKELLE